MKQINVSKAKELLDNEANNYTFIDVRSKLEFMAKSIKGFKNIPLNKLPRKTDDIDMDKPVIVICASGARSGRACSYLESVGFEAYNVSGGIARA